jgi:CBS domain-containing protein
MPFVSEPLPNVAPKLRKNCWASRDRNLHIVDATAPGAVGSRRDTLYSPSASWQSERVIMVPCGAGIAYLGRWLFSEERAMGGVTHNLAATDFMQRDVVTVSPDDTLRDALALMTENHVTGLPVMDGNSRCVGLITSSDILNYEQEHADDSAESGMAKFFDPDTQQWESVSMSAFGLEEFGDVRVSEVMTRDLIWVERNTSLKDVARRMIDERVHRVLVMDKSAALYGLISAYDLVRVVAER